jgi:RHS repeat-associated protein
LHTTSLAKLEADHLYAIHTDHRGAPLAMTDEDQALVWQAELSPWGTGKTTGPASLNLRLPGQYYDAETGLHDNWHRTYDPATGRYLQPDPLGYPDGPDAYLYASGDPVNHSDPTGLYQSDVHYYLTYFLGIAAGIDQEDARIIALATQYIDDNPLTWAVNDHSPLTMVASMFTNEDALTHYHFTMYDYVGKSTDLSLWSSSAQIMNLLNAPDIALQQLQDQALLPASMQTVHCKAPMQLMGEALHALQDTFGHRNADNESYSPTWRPAGIDTHIGIGHGLDFSKPDYTYDFGDWTNNYSRTMEMAKTVFDQLVAFAGKIDHQGQALNWSDIEGVVSDFAKTEASEEGGNNGATMKQKIEILSTALNDPTLEWGVPTGNSYDKGAAQKNRNNFLANLDAGDFPGVMFK